jgi:tRNA threonylcarbamoyladenosine biosynthesis protein TsaB
VFERFELAPQRHAELILPMCEAVLNDAGLRLAEFDGLAFGRGPGSFTGVRIAVGVIQGIALGSGLKVVPVSSLAALAQGLWREQQARRVITAMDARMNELYYGAFSVDEHAVMQPAFTERLCVPSDAEVPAATGWIGAGTGFLVYAGILGNRLAACLADTRPASYPHAQDVITLALPAIARGEAVDAEYALPVYLRDRVVTAAPG